MAIIAPQPRSLKELIRDRYYEIPLYQRPYDWGIDQVSDLWDDIDKNDPGYFLGIVLFRPSKSEDPISNEFHIVDGQQRLATILLLLRAAVESLEEINAKREANEFQKEYIAQRPAGKNESNARLTLVLSKRDRDKFEYLLRGQIFSNKRHLSSWRNLDNTIAFFRNKLRQLAENKGKDGIIDFLNDKVLQLSFIEIRLKTDSDVYQFFETLNDRGKDLEIADLVKNRVCAEAKREQQDEESSALSIDDISEKLGAGNLKNFFLHYCWANDTDENPKPRKELMDWYEKYIAKFHNVKKFLDHFDKYAAFYVNFVEPNKCDDSAKKRALIYIDALNASRCYPLLLVGEDILKKKDFVRLCKAIEILTARHSTILKRDAKVLEGVFYELVGKIRNKKEINEEILNIFRSQESMKIDEQFKAAFSDFSPANHKVARYILSQIEEYIAGKKQAFLSWEDLTLEHILAEKLKWNGRDEYLDRIGNLTLLSLKMNSDAANKPFKEKRERNYKKEKRIEMTKELINYSDFTKDTIIERQKNLTNRAVKIWNSKNIN